MRTTHTNIIEDCPDCGFSPLIVAYRGNGDAAYVKCSNKTCKRKPQKEWEVYKWNARARKANAPV